MKPTQHILISTVFALLTLNFSMSSLADEDMLIIEDEESELMIMDDEDELLLIDDSESALVIEDEHATSAFKDSDEIEVIVSDEEDDLLIIEPVEIASSSSMIDPKEMKQCDTKGHQIKSHPEFLSPKE